MIRRLGSTPGSSGGLKSWLLDGAYVPSLNADGSVQLTNITPNEILPYINHDFERFALSSAESLLIASVESTNYGLSSWPLLKLYYAAFFAAHAVMRSQGSGVTKVDKAHLKKINDFLAILGNPPSSMTPGTYVFDIDFSQPGSVVLNFTPHSSGSGVHEAFWKSFCEFLGRQSNAALTSNAAGAQIFLAGTEEIKAAIGGSYRENSSWISAMRNQINYQHLHSVWFPQRKSDKTAKAIAALKVRPSNQAVLGTPAKKDPVKAFIEVANYLACLNIDLSEYVAARSTMGSAFGQKWRRMFEQLP